jgi:RNA polymerase-binding protein DksA
MAKANPRGAVAGRAKGATGPRPSASKSADKSSAKGAVKPAAKSVAKKEGAQPKSAPPKSASVKPAAKAPPSKAAPAKAAPAKATVTKNGAAAKSGAAKPVAANSATAKGAAAKAAPPAKGAAKGAPAKGLAAAIAAAKSAAAKGSDKNKKNSREKSTVTKGGADKKGADAKDANAPPAVPPRRIQVMQVSSLKPGAKGSKASVALIETRTEEKLPEGTDAGAKKRRSAELTKQQLDHFRELLSQRRERLASDLHMMQDEALKVTAQDNSSDSVADTGTDNYEQDFTLGLIESEEVLAREVDEALLRIEQSKFGVCESCETPVPLARLEILPFARFCITCQQKRESQG